MEASMCGLDAHAARPGIRTTRKTRSVLAEGGEGSSQTQAARQDAARDPAQRVQHALMRVEHALFALILGCVGCVWLGALVAEAVRL